MSHFTRIRTKLVDDGTLRTALERLGYQVVDAGEGVTGWRGGKTQAEFKISPGKGEYEIGFLKERSAYAIVADWYGIRSVSRPDFVNRVAQEYAVAGTLQTLVEKGFELSDQERETDGTVRLTLRRAI